MKTDSLGENSSYAATLELPAAHHSADMTSLRGQGKYLALTRWEFILIFMGAGVGFSTQIMVLWTDPDTAAIWARGLGVGGATLFAGALLVRAYKATERPEGAWHDGRAIAESVKTLAWRYSVGGLPFAAALPPAEADRLFVQRLTDILTKSSLSLLPAPSEDGQQITSTMRTLRAAPLGERRLAYERGRVGDQQRWYSSRSGWNLRRQARWNQVVIFFEAIGVVSGGATALAFPEPGIDWLSLVAAATAALAAWLQARQHGLLASTYALAAQELSAIRTLIPYQQDDEEWARFVSSAEGAISREHTMWRAARTR